WVRDPVIEWKGKVGAEHCDRLLCAVYRRRELVRHVTALPRLGCKGNGEFYSRLPCEPYVTYDTLNPVTPAHYASFFLDIPKARRLRAKNACPRQGSQDSRHHRPGVVAGGRGGRSGAPREN